MSVPVEVAPKLFAWARERSGKGDTYLLEKFPHLPEWEDGNLIPTLRELERFANATYTPVGAFFLEEPPIEELPIADFRTVRSQQIATPSSDLIDTISICQRRQDWYRDFARSTSLPPVEFVGSLQETMSVVDAAEILRNLFDLDLEERTQISTWSDTLVRLRTGAEDAGILVMINGVVGANNTRTLDPLEFRGFVLVDDYAPVVFVNGADAKSAQIFTLAHELVHVGLGASSLSSASADIATLANLPTIERWCNEVAAEFLVPELDLVRNYDPHTNFDTEVQRLARRYKVSSLVVLRRLFDLKHLSYSEFAIAVESLSQHSKATVGSSGGNFYNTQIIRVGQRFARALIGDTVSGNTLYRDAYRLLGFDSHKAFLGLGRKLGVL